MSDYNQSSYGSAAPNSTMAIVSLVSAILGFTLLPFIGSIVAVITAPMAKKEIEESGGTLSGEGLAQAGLILGWVGVGLGVIGICIGGFFIAIPLCISIFAIASEEISVLLPLLAAL